jgi:hypothetical protein
MARRTLNLKTFNSNNGLGELVLPGMAIALKIS